MENNESKVNLNAVIGERRMTRSAAGRGRRGEASQVVIMRTPPRNNVENNNEADHHINSESSQPDTLVNRIAAEELNVTKNRRLKWSREMNQEIVKTFLLINDCRDDPLPGWRQKLHREFTKLYPNLELSEQNAADRLRAIYSRKLLSVLDIDELRREAGNQIYNQQIIESVQTNMHEELPETEHQEQDRAIGYDGRLWNVAGGGKKRWLIALTKWGMRD
ncbi:unnamed protein product [Psylliodes chrysocephalus]|uniref:Uncharacterized protein n=1 Tax=Psylliodes chrysocephalus TaxID=3402493 RepID=A0A9P0CW32_9CUCU|nr:unnamed protein product [Psylliodes chrysocephala]